MALTALLLLVGAAGCSDSDRAVRRTAATVGDVEISQAEVQELMSGQVAFAKLQAAAAAKAAKAAPTDANLAKAATDAKAAAADLQSSYGGTGGADTFGTAGAAEVLSTAIQKEIYRQAAADAGVKVTKVQISEARAGIITNLKGRNITSTKGFEALLDASAELQAYQQALTTKFASSGPEREAQLQAAFTDALPAQSQYCIYIIATADEASAQAAYARVQAGEDFLAVGNEVSLQKENLAEGKELCITGAQLTGVFTSVELPVAADTVLAPADGQGSWIFVKVVSAQVPTFEQLKPQLEQSVADDAATAKVQKAVAKAQKQLDVTVDRRYGTWDAKAGIVNPPKAEPSGTTTSTTLPVTVGSDPAGS